MSGEHFTAQHRVIGSVASYAVSLLLVVYAVTTILGFLSLESPLDPIGDPYFLIMELLIVLIAPLMVLVMIAVHAWASPGVKLCSLAALLFMVILAAITSGVHFVMLTVYHQALAAGLSPDPLYLSFEWPSAVYALDILAWDWFFALSMFFAAPVFSGGRLNTAVRALMVVSGVLSLAGLAGVALADMQVRDIGIIGYSLVAIFVFILLGMVFGRTQTVAEDRE